MKVFRVVADSSCIIALSQIEQFNLLKELFLEIYIPEAVYEEVVIKGKGEVGSKETEKAIKDGWIKKKTVIDKIAVQALLSILGKGESEVIIFCKELKLDYALIDETTARDMAELMDVNVIGAIGIIDLAVENKFDINKRSLIDRLIEMGFRISDKLYKQMFPD